MDLKDGVIDLLNALHAKSEKNHLFRFLIHYIASRLPIALAAEWFNTSFSTIKRARRLTETQLDESLLFVERYVPTQEYDFKIFSSIEIVFYRSLDQYRPKELLYFKEFLLTYYLRPSPTSILYRKIIQFILLFIESDNSEFFQQETTLAMYEKYKLYVAQKNVEIVCKLPIIPKVDYTIYSKSHPTNAFHEYGIIPIRAYQTFCKMREGFTIRHYKKDWR